MLTYTTTESKNLENMSFYVHKDSVFSCILNEKVEKILEDRFGTLKPDFDKLRDELVNHNRQFEVNQKKSGITNPTG